MFIFLTAPALALDEDFFEIKVTINKVPSLSNFYPADGDTVTEGDTLNIGVEADDPNDDSLEYKFYINGEVERDWGLIPTFTYTLTSDEIGLNTIRAEITDGMEVIETDEIEIYVFRASPGFPDEQ